MKSITYDWKLYHKQRDERVVRNQLEYLEWNLVEPVCRSEKRSFPVFPLLFQVLHMRSIYLMLTHYSGFRQSCKFVNALEGYCAAQYFDVCMRSSSFTFQNFARLPKSAVCTSLNLRAAAELYVGFLIRLELLVLQGFSTLGPFPLFSIHCPMQGSKCNQIL